MTMQILVVVLTVLLSPCAVRSFLTHDGDFDYFTYAQSWPPGVCVAGIQDHHKCYIGPTVKSWTVHGLWPSVWKGEEPFFCNKSLIFDFSQIASLQVQMQAQWPNLYNDTEPDSFWKHEWEKHGTCALTVGATANEFKFFSQGLALNAKYDIASMLAKGGIVPDPNAKYNYKQFIDAIQSQTGQEPVLGCTYEKLPDGTPFHLIEQIEICLDKSFSVISCYDPETSKLGKNGHVREPYSNCPRNYAFSYPLIKHL